MGYVIDYDHMRTVYPNNSLASSVKALMKQRDCDVSVALITSNPANPYVVINDYDRDKDSYGTNIIPLYKQNNVEQKKQMKNTSTNRKANSKSRTDFAQELYKLRHHTFEDTRVGTLHTGGIKTLQYRYIYYDNARMVNGYIVDLDGNIRSDIGIGRTFDEMYPIVPKYSVSKEIRDLAMKSLE